MDIPGLVLQASLVGGCLTALFLFAVSFPFPSPLIKPLLSPEKRWPTAQVRQWVRSDSVPTEFLAFFSRDPERSVPAGQNIVAPADGVIRSIARTPEWTYIDIALSFWDVHVQRSPVKGRIQAILAAGDTFMDGEFRDRVYLRDKIAPVQTVLDIDSAWGLVRVRLVTSFNARRIRVWVHDGETMEKGQRIGRILLGSTVILQLPPELSLAIKSSERVVAGESIVSRGAGPP